MPNGYEMHVKHVILSLALSSCALKYAFSPMILRLFTGYFLTQLPDFGFLLKVGWATRCIWEGAFWHGHCPQDRSRRGREWSAKEQSCNFRKW